MAEDEFQPFCSRPDDYLKAYSGTPNGAPPDSFYKDEVDGFLVFVEKCPLGGRVLTNDEKLVIPKVLLHIRNLARSLSLLGLEDFRPPIIVHYQGMYRDQAGKYALYAFEVGVLAIRRVQFPELSDVSAVHCELLHEIGHAWWEQRMSDAMRHAFVEAVATGQKDPGRLIVDRAASAYGSHQSAATDENVATETFAEWFAKLAMESLCGRMPVEPTDYFTGGFGSPLSRTEFHTVGGPLFPDPPSDEAC